MACWSLTFFPCFLLVLLLLSVTTDAQNDAAEDMMRENEIDDGSWDLTSASKLELDARPIKKLLAAEEGKLRELALSSRIKRSLKEAPSKDKPKKGEHKRGLGKRIKNKLKKLQQKVRHVDGPRGTEMKSKIDG